MRGGMVAGAGLGRWAAASPAVGSSPRAAGDRAIPRALVRGQARRLAGQVARRQWAFPPAGAAPSRQVERQLDWRKIMATLAPAMTMVTHIMAMVSFVNGQ